MSTAPMFASYVVVPSNACSEKSLEGVDVIVCDESESSDEVLGTLSVSLIIMLTADIHTCVATISDPVGYRLTPYPSCILGCPLLRSRFSDIGLESV